MINTRNLHLTVSAIIITIVAFTYGLFTVRVLPVIFDFKPCTTDLKEVFRASMGLYLGMVVFWVIGIFKTSYWRAATIINILFMGGLAIGRMISMLADGIPSLPFSIGLVVELILAIWGIINLKKYVDR